MVSQRPTGLGPPVVAFAGGGTGGHLYPALAVADALQGLLSGLRLVFFATHRPIDQRILSRADCEVVRQTLPPLCKAPWLWPRILGGYLRSSRLCRSRLESDRPMIVIGTGGLSSVPAVRAAHRAGIPTAVLNPDAVPGRANRHLAGLADAVFAQWEETIDLLPRRAGVRVCGCAIRPEFNTVSRAAAVEHFNLDPTRKTLLVTGASQGARTINEAVLANLDLLESLINWQVLHLSGNLDFGRVKDAYEGRSIRAQVLAFTDRMAEALGAADLVISRSGASTLAEITALGRASILMPYPFHKDMHQLANARCLARVSAARIVDDAVDPAVNGPALRLVLESLMSDDGQREAMAAAAKRIGRGRAAGEIAEQIVELAERRGTLPVRETMECIC